MVVDGLCVPVSVDAMYRFARQGNNGCTCLCMFVLVNWSPRRRRILPT
jgi:hypothetical protein